MTNCVLIVFTGVRVAEKEAEHKWREMEREAGSRRRLLLPLTTDSAPTVGFTNLSWDWLEQTTPTQVQGSEARGGGVTEEIQQVRARTHACTHDLKVGI